MPHLGFGSSTKEYISVVHSPPPPPHPPPLHCIFGINVSLAAILSAVGFVRLAYPRRRPQHHHHRRRRLYTSRDRWRERCQIREWRRCDAMSGGLEARRNASTSRNLCSEITVALRSVLCIKWRRRRACEERNRQTKTRRRPWRQSTAWSFGSSELEGLSGKWIRPLPNSNKLHK